MLTRRLTSCFDGLVVLITAGLAVSLLFPSSTSAQRRKVVTLPKPELVTVTTRDGIQIRCAYYPGGVIERRKEDAKSRNDNELVEKPGKQVVPIILLHGWSGSRTEYSALANVLQRRGHAVIVPDLRGHGESLTRRLPNGLEQKLDRDRMRPADLHAMIFDVEAVKKFLLKKNNAEELNIEMLCVVGAELGAIVGVNWAERDWSRRQLPTFKQGRDVKALVLLSPRQSFKGLTPNKALQHPVVGSKLSIMIVAGTRDRDAKSIHKRLERLHRSPSDPKDQDLFFVDPETSLKGTKLVDPRAKLPVTRMILAFVDRRLASQGSLFGWRERRNPLAPTD